VDDPESRPRRRFLGEVVVAGSIAGIFGGAVTTLLAVATAAVLGADAGLPLKLVSGAIFRDAALSQLHGGAVFWGLVLVFALAGGVGVGFALLLPRGGTSLSALFLAAGYGLLLYVLLVELGLWADPLLEHALPREALFPYVLLFGCCCALVAPLRKIIRPVEALVERAR
jgi:hypothetical protein